MLTAQSWPPWTVLQLVPGDATQVNFRPCDACVQALLLQVLAASAEAAPRCDRAERYGPLAGAGGETSAGTSGKTAMSATQRRATRTLRDMRAFSSSGTGAMEASVANLFSPGDKVLVINGGKFGERWLNIANAYGE